MIEITEVTGIEKDTLYNAIWFVYTPLCGTCVVAEKMLSVIEVMKPEFSIYKANANYIPSYMEQWRIHSVPALIHFKNGNPVDIIYAFHSVEFLYKQIQVWQSDKSF